MQTFLPYDDFVKSAKCLDSKRLGKQRVEIKQLLQRLLNETNGKGWVNHPAVKMWRGYERALAKYGYLICEEWIKRGYNDSLLIYFKERIGKGKIKYPPWFGREDFHSAHRSNLLRKDKEYYSVYEWTEPDNLEYIWPI